MIFTLLLFLVPVSLVLARLVSVPPLAVFVVSAAAIVPLAEWTRRATEQLARRVGPSVGGLLNVTFGNTAELVLALLVLSAGHAEVVKAQITGSIIGNSLLGLGLAAVVGGLGRVRQRFRRANASRLGSLLILSMIALLVPALFDFTEQGRGTPSLAGLEENLSLAVSVVLILAYAANLVYSLVTHRDIFASERDSEPASWSALKSIAVLVGATAAIAVEAEMVSGALTATAKGLGLSEFFLGITVLAIVGNAAEYVAAVYFARKDQMGMVMSITVGSTVQVALFMAPVLVIVSWLMGTPMNLVFSNPLELVAIAGAALAVNAIAEDGETTWFEGVLLLTVYVVLGAAFFFVKL